jgi:anaerobic selenocysteine-containing dehydrogenase
MASPAPASSTEIETACPLDCPDACTLVVTVANGRIQKIDGSPRNEITNGYICAKVRRFDQRVYGPERLRYPAVRRGPKGSADFRRVNWDEALDLITGRIREITAEFGPESILPFSHGGSNGLLTQDMADATLFRRLGTSRLLRAACSAPTSAANMGLYGKMPSVSYQDYPAARLIVLWGVNPAQSGIHIMPFLKQARDRGATLIVVDPRCTTLARQADMFVQVRPGTDLPVALALHRYLFEHGGADWRFLDEHTTDAARLREKAAQWTFERAADVSGVSAAQLQMFAELYAEASPALVKCGWGLERNRNGGSAAAAVLALPAVAGKFGVRGGGYSMSNSASWRFERTWVRDDEPRTRTINMNQLGRALVGELDAGEGGGAPIKCLFVYNCNPAVTMPDQTRVIKGLEREDLFTVVFDQVLTDTARYADVVLPATTFLEHYDFAKGYGPITLQIVRPVIDRVGEARPNADVFADLGRRLGVARAHDPSEETAALDAILSELPTPHGAELRHAFAATPPHGGRPVQFADVWPATPDGKVHLLPASLDRQAPLGLYGFQPDPATAAYPLALISPATERTISSTLGELARPQVALEIHPDDAAARGVREHDVVRMFNEGGEVRLRAHISPHIKPGTVAMPKGVWRRHIVNGFTANALVPDTLADLGGGACFNDARVQVEKAEG